MRQLQARALQQLHERLRVGLRQASDTAVRQALRTWLRVHEGIHQEVQERTLRPNPGLPAEMSSLHDIRDEPRTLPSRVQRGSRRQLLRDKRRTWLCVQERLCPQGTVWHRSHSRVVHTRIHVYFP